MLLSGGEEDLGDSVDVSFWLRREGLAFFFFL